VSKVKSKVEEQDENNEGEIDEILLPGQKNPIPPLVRIFNNFQGDPVRAFYESLYEQKPNSIMALKYCIENGCLDQEKVMK